MTLNDPIRPDDAEPWRQPHVLKLIPLMGRAEAYWSEEVIPAVPSPTKKKKRTWWDRLRAWICQ